MTIKTTPKTLLIIDDDAVFCEAVKGNYADTSIEVLVANTAADGLAVVSHRRVDVVLLDQRLPDAEGHTLCEPILEHNEQVKIIFITAHPSFESVVTAMRCGAYDYLSKPFELEELGLAIERACRTIELEMVEQVQNYRVRKESEQAVLIGADGGLAETVRLVNLAAAVDSPVLITGETGTGKNVAAMAIHYKSARKENAFISINCASLPENLIEAELFGYEKGAFTGAVSAKRGIFEMADGGTLFLDEIGEIPLHLQSKLLSVLEEKKIRRLGGESVKTVKVRIIASTGVPLETVIGKRFRQDLYYRLSVMRIHMPPLRDRRDDIPELCRYLLSRLPGGAHLEIHEDEIALLMTYDWPGNVRELGNIIERALILQKGPVLRPSELLALPQTVPGSSGTYRYTHCLASSDILTLAEIERDYIRVALEKLSNNYTRTAKALGISLSTLKRKLSDYGLK